MNILTLYVGTYENRNYNKFIIAVDCWNRGGHVDHLKRSRAKRKRQKRMERIDELDEKSNQKFGLGYQNTLVRWDVVWRNFCGGCAVDLVAESRGESRRVAESRGRRRGSICLFLLSGLCNEIVCRTRRVSRAFPHSHIPTFFPVRDIDILHLGFIIETINKQFYAVTILLLIGSMLMRMRTIKNNVLLLI